MGYLPEPKTTTVFVTACKAVGDGRARNIVLETRPEFAILKLEGTRKRYPLAWERIFELAAKHEIVDRQLQNNNPKRSNKSPKS